MFSSSHAHAWISFSFRLSSEVDISHLETAKSHHSRSYVQQQERVGAAAQGGGPLAPSPQKIFPGGTGRPEWPRRVSRAPPQAASGRSACASASGLLALLSWRLGSQKAGPHLHLCCSPTSREGRLSLNAGVSSLRLQIGQVNLTKC